jgi:hypothetical protein
LWSVKKKFIPTTNVLSLVKSIHYIVVVTIKVSFIPVEGGRSTTVLHANVVVVHVGISALTLKVTKGISTSGSGIGHVTGHEVFW